MTQEQKDYINFDFIPAFYKEVGWLFTRRNMDGLFPVFFILYSYKHGLPISFGDSSMKEHVRGKDSLQDRLYDASLMTFGGEKSQFVRLRGLQEKVESLERELYDEIYPSLLDCSLVQTDLADGTQMQPNSRIATTVACILKEHGCKTVFGAFSGIGIYALACEGMKYTGAEPYAPANLIAEVFCDAFEIKDAEFINENPLSKWTRRKFDAVIGNLPVDADFFNVFRADKFLHSFNVKQNSFIKTLIERCTARKVAALLIHFEFANYRAYDQTRKLICDNGLLEAVIALPEDIFRESLVPTYLLILDMEGGHTDAEFMDATKSKYRQPGNYTYRSNRFDIRESVKDNERVRVDYETISRAAWSFNPAVYIQNAECRDGQQLVRLGDLVRVSSGEMADGERFIPYNALSDSFSRVAAGITPSAASKEQKQLVEGPSVMIALTRGSRRESQKLTCGICREHGTYSVEFFLCVLKPDPERILPDYLALALMEDPSFANYFKSIQEYYTDDDVRSAHILERQIPILTDLSAQKKAVMDALGRADMAEVSYNIIVAGAGDMLGWYRSTFSKHGCTILYSVDTVEGPDGLDSLLSDLSRDNTPVSKRADAVVFLSDIPLSEADDEDPFAGFDAVLDLNLTYGKNGLKFFASSRNSLDEIRNSGIISSRRLKPIAEGHFFMTDDEGHPTSALAASVREELDRTMSPESRIRSRHREAFEAAEWLDEAYAERDIRASETISEFLMAAEEGVDTSRDLSDLRNVAHRIIEILKDCRAVPPIDNGAVPKLLYERKYQNKKDGKVYIQDVSIMRRSLISSLISLIDIGNEGTHSFKTSANLGSAMLQTLLEFITWIYEKRDEFGTVLTNYWHIDSEYERSWEETSGPVKLHMVAGKPHWTCEDVHLFVPTGIDLQEGDIVTVRARSADNGKVRIPGVKFFAYPKDNRNPEGYTIDKSWREPDPSE